VSERPESPFKGLAPFGGTALDALLFFGRERERDIVVANLMASRLTLLYGPSGVGKSSLLNAGVARALVESPEGHRVASFDSWVEDRCEELRAERDAAAGGYLYLILDQFEEFFLYQEVDGPFARELAALLADRGLRVNVLLSLREDSLALLDALKGRISNLYGNSLRLDHLDRASARAAVVGPLRTYSELTGEHVGAEPELVEAVLDEVATGRLELVEAGRGGLEEPARDGRIEAPFLQLVLERLWDAEREAGSDTLRLQTLLRLGGAEAVVREHLERALAGLAPEQKDLAANVFDHLVTPSGTKIAHRASDLAEYASVGEGELAQVLDALGQERILREVDGPDGGGARYEIFHDVLSDPVLAWRAERRLERQREEADRRHRRLLILAASALAGLAIMGAVAVYALAERHHARAQAAVARAQTRLAHSQTRLARSRAFAEAALVQLNTDPQRSVELALQAARLEPTRGSEDILRDVLLASRLRLLLPADPAADTGAAFNPAGSLVATAGADGKARLVATRSGRLLAALPQGGRVTSVLFNRDGRLLVTTSVNGETRIWRVRGKVLLHRLRGAGAVTSAALSDDGRLLAAARTNRRVDVSRLRDGKRLAVIRLQRPARSIALSPDGALVAVVSGDRLVGVYATHGGRLRFRLQQDRSVTSAAFSPRGDMIATTGLDGTARIWDAGSGALLRTLVGHHGAVLDAAFSTHGRLLVTAGADGTARVWRVADGDARAVLLGHTNYVTSAAFSRDATWIVTTSRDRTARVWETAKGRPRVVLAGHRSTVESAVFDRSGDELVTVGDDGTARVWQPGTENQLALLGRHPGPVSSVAVSPDGRLVVSAGADGTARIWALRSHRLLHPLRHRGAVRAAVFSSDGRLVATASADGTVGVWDVGTGRRLLALRQGAPVVDVAFSPDAALVAGAGADGTARVWLVPSGQLKRSFGRGAPLTTVAFSRDGTLLTAGGRSARLWDVAAGRLAHTLSGHRAGIVDAVFSPDGRLVATASADRTAKLWDARSGGLLGTLEGHGDALTSVAFDPSGKLLVTASLDHDARVWDVASRRLLFPLRGHFAAVSSAAFSPDGRWIVTAGPQTAGLWETSSGKLLLLARGHRRQVTSAVFAPDGRRIVTAGLDGTVRTYRCALCGSTADLIAIAEARIARLRRPLTPSERRRYLPLR
jgi:WD40 repeat protein